VAGLSGREYKIIEAENYRPNDYPWEPLQVRYQEYPFTVVEGAWVAETWADYQHKPEYEKWFFTVGPEPNIFKLGPAPMSWKVPNFLCVGSEPFGIVNLRLRRSEPVGGLHFQPAQLVHKGELGKHPDVATPPFAREALDQTSSWADKPDRKRGYVSWARLVDVAKMAGLTPEQVMLDYWGFVDYKYDPEWDHEPHMDVIRANSHEEIHCQKVDPRMRGQFTETQVRAMVSAGFSDWDKFWIRRGFAKVVLYLLYLQQLKAQADPHDRWVFQEL
jgi:hypothetical protein